MDVSEGLVVYLKCTTTIRILQRGVFFRFYDGEFPGAVGCLIPERQSQTSSLPPPNPSLFLLRCVLSFALFFSLPKTNEQD
ncbi:Uncharacterized protein APZ42_008634 [Daphnia magna]|uniref:Uncharacterized protein n=1 Tax=Daphnia magna TaxID=35525 RepID=A0A164EIH7_9CRUS|nr:Uncharacterized protein APZ42_008634 [Daphnia magna]